MNTKETTIVLVDDEDDLRTSLRIELRRAKYDVVEFTNGADALSFFQQADLRSDWALITDIVMPRLSGLDLIREVRKLMSDIPIIAMTGYGDKPMVIDLMHSGCDDFLDKPFSCESLLETLTQSIDIKQVRREHQIIRFKALEAMEREFDSEKAALQPARPNKVSPPESTTNPDHVVAMTMGLENEYFTVQLQGNLTTARARELKNELEQQLSNGVYKYRFDLKDVHDIDALGLSVLCALAQEIRQNSEGTMEMIQVEDRIRRLLQQLGLENDFGVKA